MMAAITANLFVWPAAWLLVLSTQQVLEAHALVGRNQPTQSFSLLSIDQVPGPKPLYVAYGEPEFTTFSNSTTACQACVEFFPVKEDGGRSHSALHKDKNGGIWAQSCHAGPCNFRDPQTEPVGGVVGKGTGPGGTPDGKTCLTRDPVPWFTPCEPVLYDATASMLDVTRYCSYKEQIFVPPPEQSVSRFAGKPHAWARIGGSKEQCLDTINTQGAKLFDEMSFCDADMEALNGCCETVFGALTCVAETASERISIDKSAIFASMTKEAAEMLKVFSNYCVPLCQNTKAEFCSKFPTADVCVTHNACDKCTAQGGIWCPKLKSCHCPSKDPPCIAPPITMPLKCPVTGGLNGAGLRGGSGKGSSAAFGHGQDGKGAGAGRGDDGNNALCKYADMARQWDK